MPFPSHILRVLDDYGVRPDTKAALYDLYVSLGDEVLEVFIEIAEAAGGPAMLQPEDTETIRARVVERYVRRSHPRWIDGLPTPSLWHPRELEGRASGVALPLGAFAGDDPSANEFVANVERLARSIVGDTQPLPHGVLVQGRNAHYGGRQETMSFDVVAYEVDDAVALARAAGQQHTLPGSAGETSGTTDAVNMLALIWEVQPNVYKPSDERNREIVSIYRRHRNWHVVTLVAALEWLRERRFTLYVLRGSALATTHEVNAAKPVTEMIAALHDRTVANVTAGLGYTLVDATDDDGFALLQSHVMNHALRQHVLRNGASSAIARLVVS
jgi:hypothetical protein